ncbi:hypothetical protein HGRIS_010620 [Hohenbuehelia grisea]|uniref:Uncharacterized protein n=1 Tax=Hohenbuehelia grisea TaxID=104357 RepID=A0ABR3IXZ7_9AGAR
MSSTTSTPTEVSVEDNLIVRKLQNNLEPPFGTLYFKTERVVILNEETIPISMVASPNIYKYTIAWNVQLYKYAVNGDPHDPDFIKNGGQIYVIMVHSGAIQTSENPFYMRFEFEVAPQGGSNNISALYQYPTTGSGVQVDNKATVLAYEIDFGQTFQMLANGGNEPMSFEAKYYESFTRVESMQKGDKTGMKTMFAITPNSGKEDPENGTLPANTIYQIYGFSVFTNQTLSSWPAKYTFTHRIGFPEGFNLFTAPPKWKSVEIDLGF